MTIRVLHVVTTMDMGGLETFIMNIYRNIDRNKVQFDFLKHRDYESKFDREIKKMGGNIYNVPPINPFKHRRYIKSLDNFFELYSDYSIVHSHINTNSMYVLRSAQTAEISTRIAHSHIASQSRFSYRAPYLKYTKFKLQNYTTHNFACGVDAGRWLYGNKAYENSEFKVINNSIDTNKFIFNKEVRNFIREKYNLQNKFVIGHIGRFFHQKNHDFIIEIFKKISDKNNNARLLLLGDGELRQDIEKKVEKYDLKEKVIFTGVKSNANEYLQAMDLFLMPSHFEGLPVTLVEAQASGVQSVISDNITDEVKITNLVDSLSLEQSPTYWAEHVNKYSVGYQRKDMSEEIKNAGYDVKTTAKWLEEFYLKEHYKHQKDN